MFPIFNSKHRSAFKYLKVKNMIFKKFFDIFTLCFQILVSKFQRT